MRGHRGTPRLAVAAALCLLASLPFVVGQGCGGNGVIPIDGGLNQGTESTTGGNVAPTFRFTAPAGTVNGEIGDIINLTWTDSDPDDDAAITILLDPDTIINNGNEIPVATGLSENDPTNALSVDTGLYALTTGSYRIIARISDGVNPEVAVAAAGQLNLAPAGANPNNASPKLVASLPAQHLSVSNSTQVTVNYCGNDRDGGEGGIVADVLILLDLDTNPLNDLFAEYNYADPTSATSIAQICAGDLPFVVGGSVVLGCAKDDKCVDPAVGTNFPVTIDATRIPQSGGNPYHVRVSMWDHTNPPVHAYAPGTLSLTALASGTVDLGNVGRTTTGCRLIGFDTGARAGSTGTTLGDFDSDGAEDFVLVARYGRPFERGNVGSAYLVYGTPGQRFGSDIYLNSYGVEYRGCCFASGHAGPYYRYAYFYGNEVTTDALTDGITAVSSIEDMTGDGRPEILFGLPYAELWWDYHDDDPCDEDGRCYFDGMPNPLMTEDPENDDISAWDYREGMVTIDNPDPIPDQQYFCSNDSDPLNDTPLNQGYIIYVSSNNPLENSVIDLPMIGQKDPDEVATEEGLGISGSVMPNGARLRGGWFSFASSINSDEPLFTGFDGTNQFGRTLGSVPDISNGLPTPRRDGSSEYLVSLPSSYQTRGSFIMIWGEDLGSFCAQPVQSIPDYQATDTDPCYRWFNFPNFREVIGARPGDKFGYADRAGDFNRDGHQDILCGAPGSDDEGRADVGTVYVIFGRLDFGNLDLSLAVDANDPNRKYIPRLEIRGTNAGDGFGEMQTLAGDINNDGYGDVAFASKLADGPGGTDCGAVGIVFGGRSLTGESIYRMNAVGSSQLPGCMFYGTQRGGHAGATIANVGDFNADGFDDLMISAPNEVRVINGQTRRGVGYLIFGGPHLANNKTRSFFLLSEVGTAALPGIVLVSPYLQASADEATIDWVGAAGDVDGDGFNDILVGVSEADFVNPYDPSQRRVDAGEAYLIYGNNSGSNVVGK